jgi:hypothetical protein
VTGLEPICVKKKLVNVLAEKLMLDLIAVNVLKDILKILKLGIAI